ncbi:MAG TPA: 30S ribosomal protein S5 [Candidatus Paceibacterota bacterium]|mgnify:CR=1 FL=1|nr:30S ribosomal protein S5 [Candidatus Paceibacterota bacterium]
MSDETKNKEIVQETNSQVSTPDQKSATTPTAASTETATPITAGDEKRTFRGRGGDRGDFKKNKRTSKRKPAKARSEFEQKIIDIRRVTRVSSGGRRFSFSVAVVVGNKKGKVGVGMGKAGDTSLAIDKAFKDAQKKAILVNTTKSMSIPHSVNAKFNSARVIIMPAPGRGIIAGSSLRDIIELGGFADVNCKIVSGSKNKLNIAKATIKAMSTFSNTKIIERTPRTEIKK